MDLTLVTATLDSHGITLLAIVLHAEFTNVLTVPLMMDTHNVLPVLLAIFLMQTKYVSQLTSTV